MSARTKALVGTLSVLLLVSICSNVLQERRWRALYQRHADAATLTLDHWVRSVEQVMQERDPERHARAHIALLHDLQGLQARADALHRMQSDLYTLAGPLNIVALDLEWIVRGIWSDAEGAPSSDALRNLRVIAGIYRKHLSESVIKERSAVSQWEALAAARAEIDQSGIMERLPPSVTLSPLPGRNP